MSFDLISHYLFEPAVVVPSAERTTTYTGPAVDMLNSEGMATLFLTGTATAVATVTMTESDDDVTYTSVTSPATSALIGNQLPLSIAINATTDTYAVNFTRSKRYVKVVIAGSGHTLVGTIHSKRKYLGS